MSQPDQSRPPATTANRPGQPAIAYRSGTHAAFLQRMLAQLQAAPALAALTTRDRDDPTIALLDAWAVAADVITFYQERIANEGFLRTATERRSALELARFVGHELGPGLAASVYLAFTVEDAPGAPAEVLVPRATRVQSIPRPGQLPQTFETAAPLQARAAANAMRLRLREPQTIGPDSAMIAGLSAGLQPGDSLLIDGGPGKRRLVTVTTVTPEPLAGHTRVAWTPVLGSNDHSAVAPQAGLYVFRQRAALFGQSAPDLRLLSDQAVAQYFKPYVGPPNLAGEAQQKRQEHEGWPGSLAVDNKTARLDAHYPQIRPGGWAAFLASGKDGVITLLLRTIRGVTQSAEPDFFLNAQTTVLVFDEALGEALPIRDTLVLLQSEELELAEQPFAAELPAKTAERTQLAMAGPAVDLTPGQPLVVSGELVGGGGATGSEIVFLDSFSPEEGQHRLKLAQPGLQGRYLRATLTVNGNIGLATHGETVAGEVLGSGDGGQANQRFKLRRGPLTHLPAPTSEGAVSTLVVRVDGVRWREVPALNGLAPHDQVYTLRRDVSGDTYVIFGDGLNGARLPSGQENVVATYRVGLGPAGNVDAGALTLLQTRPMGIRAVTNPLPATGGVAPESLADARERVPRGVLTLGRIVSARDYEDFARGFAGVGQARATMLWTGQTRLIHITVADAQGQAVPDGSALYLALEQAIKGLGNPLQRFQIDTFTAVPFNVEARLWVDPRYDAEAVAAAAQAVLSDAFAGRRRDFGQGVTASEVIVVLQGVPGVVAVDLDKLQSPPPRDDDGGGDLIAQSARWDATNRTLLRAERLEIAAIHLITSKVRP